MNSVTSSYFETMRLPIVRGRGIEPTDRTGTLPVAVVSQRFVAENFGDEDPIGQRLELTINSGDPIWTIVGLVGDVRRDLTGYPAPDVYVPVDSEQLASIHEPPGHCSVLGARAPLA